MFLEGLIVLACVNNQGGCSEGTSAYYKQSMEAQRFMSAAKVSAKEFTRENQWFVYTATPLYTLAAGKPARFKISKTFILKIDTKDPGVGVEWWF